MIVPGTGVYLNNMLGEYDLVGGKSVSPGRRLTSMMAPSLVLGRDGRPRLVVGSAGSARLRGAIMQIVVNVVEHGLSVDEAISAPRVHLDEPDVHCEGGPTRSSSTASRRWATTCSAGGGATSSSAAPRPSPRGEGRHARGRRRPAARRRRRRRMTRPTEARPTNPRTLEVARPATERRAIARIRPAEPGDAQALVALLNAVGAEPEGWLLSDASRRSVAAERRYIRSVRRHPDAALLVAELDGELVGRLSLARDPHPSSAHVADFGLTVAAAYRRRGIGTALLAAAEEWARDAGIRKLELHVFPHNRAAIALYEKVGYVREGYRDGHYRLPDGRFVDAILMAKRV